MDEDAQAAIARQHAAWRTQCQVGDMAEDVVQETAMGDDGGGLPRVGLQPFFQKSDAVAVVLAVTLPPRG